jgi:hypothetical protein
LKKNADAQKLAEEKAYTSTTTDPYFLYETPTLYLRVSFNVVMASLFLIAAIVCCLLGIFEDEKQPNNKISNALYNKKRTTVKQKLQNKKLLN